MSSRIKLSVCLVTVGLLGFAVGALADRHAERKDERKRVADAVRKAFPEAKIAEVEREREEFAVMIYEVELDTRGAEIEVLVAPDGTIVGVSEEVRNRKDVPAPVMARIRQLQKQGKVAEIEKREVRAKPKFVPLKKSRTLYEVEVIRNGREYEVRIDENGKVLSAHDDAEDDDDDGDEDDDDEDDDEDDDD
jgi:hypothetical protein